MAEGYGVCREAHLVDMVYAACNTLGYGANRNADTMLLETLAAETGLGRMRDATRGAGMGIAQFDRAPFYDLKGRVLDSSAGGRWAAAVQEDFGIALGKTEWEHLRYAPFLSIIWMRVHYLKVPAEIPLEAEARARYWKRHYNGSGKGTVSHYLRAAELVRELKGE